MIILTDEEIKNASNIIDKNLERLNDDNRGEISTNILNAVRNLNDNIAYKIWHDKLPNKPMNINKVASKFTEISGCQFIAHFDKCMRKSLSHFTPSEEGAIFLLSKYYKYIYQLKQVMKEIYNIDGGHVDVHVHAEHILRIGLRGRERLGEDGEGRQAQRQSQEQRNKLLHKGVPPFFLWVYIHTLLFRLWHISIIKASVKPFDSDKTPQLSTRHLRSHTRISPSPRLAHA